MPRRATCSYFCGKRCEIGAYSLGHQHRYLVVMRVRRPVVAVTRRDGRTTRSNVAVTRQTPISRDDHLFTTLANLSVTRRYHRVTFHRHMLIAAPVFLKCE